MRKYIYICILVDTFIQSDSAFSLIHLLVDYKEILKVIISQRIYILCVIILYYITQFVWRFYSLLQKIVQKITFRKPI